MSKIPDRKRKVLYPDMRLYQEVIFLSNWFNGKFCVENVVSYYKPLIRPQKSGNHYFWTNFPISKLKREDRNIRSRSAIKNRIEIEVKQEKIGFKITENIPKTFRKKMLNNCVLPELGLHIFNMAFNDIQKSL